MRKLLKIKWIEYHTKTIEADTHNPMLSIVPIVDDTLVDCQLEDFEIVGNVEQEYEYDPLDVE